MLTAATHGCCSLACTLCARQAAAARQPVTAQQHPGPRPARLRGQLRQHSLHQPARLPLLLLLAAVLADACERQAVHVHAAVDAQTQGKVVGQQLHLAPSNTRGRARRQRHAHLSASASARVSPDCTSTWMRVSSSRTTRGVRLGSAARSGHASHARNRCSDLATANTRAYTHAPA